jgi:U3 small nucleolar RNA-associated protein 23
LALVGSSTPSEPAKKRNGPKGPNPLSVKKKKPSAVADPPQPSIDSRPAGGKRKADHDDLEFVATKRKRKRRKRAVVETDHSGENT